MQTWYQSMKSTPLTFLQVGVHVPTCRRPICRLGFRRTKDSVTVIELRYEVFKVWGWGRPIGSNLVRCDQILVHPSSAGFIRVHAVAHLFHLKLYDTSSIRRHGRLTIINEMWEAGLCFKDSTMSHSQVLHRRVRFFLAPILRSRLQFRDNDNLLVW